MCGCCSAEGFCGKAPFATVVTCCSPMRRSTPQLPTPGSDCQFGFKKRAKLMKDPTFWRADAEYGADYEVDAHALESLQCRNTSKADKLSATHATVDAACEVLSRELAEPFTVAQLQALKRLRQAFAIKKANMTPDLLIKASKDLDTVLFNSALLDRILSMWARVSQPKGQHACGSCWPSIRGPKINIRLNKKCFFTDTKERLWGTLMHELLHAYLYLNVSEHTLGKEQHGSHFSMLSEKLVERLAFPGFKVDDVVDEQDAGLRCMIESAIPKRRRKDAVLFDAQVFVES